MSGDGRGKLKIFFGYAAGVGKTYAMLEAARQAKARGVDVAVGDIELHGRSETAVLLRGLEQLPMRQAVRGGMVREFDLDAALERRPQLILVDELAHTNAEGSRHVKRYQDVQELLRAGIDVPVCAGIMPICDPKQVARAVQLSGSIMPPRFAAIADRFAHDPKAMTQAGIAFATEQIVDLIANGVGHIHLYTMNKPWITRAIVNNLSDILCLEGEGA